MGPRPPPECRRTWKTNTKTSSQESLIRGPWQVQEEESEEEQQAGEVQCKSRRALSRNGSAGMVRFWPKFQNSKFFVLFGTPPCHASCSCAPAVMDHSSTALRQLPLRRCDRGALLECDLWGPTGTQCWRSRVPSGHATVARRSKGFRFPWIYVLWTCQVPKPLFNSSVQVFLLPPNRLSAKRRPK